MTAITSNPIEITFDDKSNITFLKMNTTKSSFPWDSPVLQKVLKNTAMRRLYLRLVKSQRQQGHNVMDIFHL